jgi:DNA-binding MarR family transcriptional regulator
MSRLTAKSPKPQPAERRRQELFLFRLFRTCFTLQASLDRRFLRAGVTFQEAAVLLHVVQNSWVTPGRLATALGRDKGKITRFVDRLVVRGLVVREPNPPDLRIKRIMPTPEGKLIARRVASLFERVQKELFVDVRLGDLRHAENTLPLLYNNAVRLGKKGNRTAAMARLKAIAEKMRQRNAEAARPAERAMGNEVEGADEGGEARPTRITRAQIDGLFPR